MGLWHFRGRWFFLACLLTLGSCATVSSSSREMSERDRWWFDQAGGLKVSEAWFGSEALYFRFQIFSPERGAVQEYAARAFWNTSLADAANRRQSVAGPVVLLSEDQWRQRPGDLEPVKTPDQDYWRQFRQGLVESITPQEQGTAAMVSVGSGELVFYYDTSGSLTIVDLTDKPAGITVTRRYSFPELGQLLAQSLRGYFADDPRGVSRVLLGIDQNRGILDPFVFVDLEREVAVGLKVEDPRLERYRMGLLKRGWKAADQLFWHSHVLGLLQRPVSSVFRLILAGAESTYEVINPRVMALLEASKPSELSVGQSMDLTAFESSLDRLTRTKARSGAMNFYIGGETFFPELIQRLQAAEKSIKIRIFIFDRDDYAVRIADVLKEKSRQGVKVKVLLDSVGIVMGESHISPSLPAGFVPPRSMVDYLRLDSKVQVRVRPSPWFRADHVKTIIIDDEIVYTGGMNIGREYRFDWHDMMMSLRGPVIGGMIRDFQMAWAHASSWGDAAYLLSRWFMPSPRLKDKAGVSVRVLATRPGEPQIYRAQIAAIRSARKYIYVHNPYFSDNTILFELIQARRRGVDVRVVMPRQGNHEIMNASNVVTANAMLRNGIRVYWYPGMTHVKAAIYDGWLCAGSANFDKLSLKDNLELNVATSDPDTVHRVRESLFEKDFMISEELTGPLPVSLREYFAKFFASQL